MTNHKDTQTLVLCQVERPEPSTRHLRKLLTKYQLARVEAERLGRDTFLIDCTIMDIEGELNQR